MADKILIIDDDLDTLKLVGLMLQKQGYEIVAANDGERGLIQAETENPDLILLDIMMPLNWIAVRWRDLTMTSSMKSLD